MKNQKKNIPHEEDCYVHIEESYEYENQDYSYEDIAEDH
jgi:hypothetical protein